MGDFETTVYNNQEFTEVWASASCELFTEDARIFHSIDEQFEYFKSLKSNLIVYYHNLKFDGQFWLDFLLIKKRFKNAVRRLGKEITDVEWLKEKFMENNTVKYSISDKGQWYCVIIKVGGHYIELRDSLKLLPFSVEKIGKSFGTKHKKLDMEYKGFRYAGCNITEKEKEYIINDVYVVKEALEIMFNEGHKKLTIGSCCLDEYKNIYRKSLNCVLQYEDAFPNLYDFPIKLETYGSENAGDYIRKSYKGGWSYLVKGKENIIYHNGVTLDVNSLYPSVMHSQSGNYYPVGFPRFWSGNYIPDEVINQKRYYFIRIKTRFYLKKNKLPFIQIKNNLLYRGNEYLESSDFYDKKECKYYAYRVDKDGTLIDSRKELTLTCTDFNLLKEQYDLVDFEILDGCFFYTVIGLFDDYIDHYKSIKINSKGAIRELAKLFLNNLYGKMAASTDSSFKLAVIKDGILSFLPVCEHNKKPGYIPVGSAITSYARNFTIRTAQKNFYGKEKSGFIYADTDSIHCDLTFDKIKNVELHDSDFLKWKIEKKWESAIFVRQKTYIEYGEGSYDIKCAGMPERCKNLLLASFMQGIDNLGKSKDNLSEDQEEFLMKDGEIIKRDMSDFKLGLVVPGKLRPKRIKGGVILVDTTYKMR